MILTFPAQPTAPANGDPFGLRDVDAYRRWRDRKLAAHPESADRIMVEVNDPARPTEAEIEAILSRVRRANMAIYATRRSGPSASDPSDKDGAKRIVRGLGARLGLRRLDANLCADDDAITPLRAVEGGASGRYIPYTNRAINWHTDGYYNPAERQIRGFILHCVCDARSGGETSAMDHEIAYILLRDENPEYVAALSHGRAMTIPANAEGGAEIRAAIGGPVFSVDPATGALHMRYTARARSVVWRDDPLTREAAGFLRGAIEGGSRFVLRHRLAPGQGLVCNNVLHARTGFRDAGGRRRLVYRARYYDRIADAAAPGAEAGEAER